MTDPESQAEREAFEAAFADKLDFLRLSPDAEYLYSETGLAWDGWKARAALPPVAAASPSGQSHPYERDLAGLTEFIDAMCAGDSKSMALVQSAWYRCMARNHPANQVVSSAEPTVKESLTVPPGWKLVPIKPTEAMRMACINACYSDHIDADWAAMLAAAPQPPDDA